MNKHLGKEDWGQAEEVTMCSGRYQGRGSVRGCHTLSLLKETLGEVTHPLWPKVSPHQRYRGTQIKLNLFTGLFHLQKLQWKSTGTCLRNLF